jgi:hypothetical protein
MENQELRRFNEVEVMLPQDGMTLPAITSESPMDLPVERFTKALTRREENRKALIKWISDNLVQGTDFGRIHVVGKDKCAYAKEGRAYECNNPRHWSKPSLWKPGAEKICGMLGLIPRFPNMREYENAVLRGEDIKIIILKCELHTPSSFVAAEGTGARRLTQDNSDINKSLKMAEKSAHIDATLRVAGLSEIFTQDLEDMTNPDKDKLQPDTQGWNSKSEPDQKHSQNNENTFPAGGENSHNAASSGQSSKNPAHDQSNGGNRITEKQHKFIMHLMKEAGMTKRELNDHCVKAYGCMVDYISRTDASSLITWFRSR